MTKFKEIVYFQHFDCDGNMLGETSNGRPQNVYQTNDGRMRINYLGGMRTVIRENGSLVAFGSQRSRPGSCINGNQLGEILKKLAAGEKHVSVGPPADVMGKWRVS